jgi:hypothetical protein
MLHFTICPNGCGELLSVFQSEEAGIYFGCLECMYMSEGSNIDMRAAAGDPRAPIG